MIEDDAEILWQSGQFTVLKISKSCWVGLTNEEFKQALILGKWLHRRAALNARLKADDAKRGKD